MKTIFLTTLIFLSACNMHNKNSKETNPKDMDEKQEMSYAGPPTIIYKTKKDYSKNVPVTMDETKSSILSFPDPKDVYYNGELSYPIKLKKGYLLDNRGINANSVFLKYTYEEYSQLKKAPDIEDLMKNILDINPFKEIWNLGNRFNYGDIEAEINEIIKKRKLQEYKRIL